MWLWLTQDHKPKIFGTKIQLDPQSALFGGWHPVCQPVGDCGSPKFTGSQAAGGSLSNCLLTKAEWVLFYQHSLPWDEAWLSGPLRPTGHLTTGLKGAHSIKGCYGNPPPPPCPWNRRELEVGKGKRSICEVLAMSPGTMNRKKIIWAFLYKSPKEKDTVHCWRREHACITASSRSVIAAKEVEFTRGSLPCLFPGHVSDCTGLVTTWLPSHSCAVPLPATGTHLCVSGIHMSDTREKD